jgi:predicted secreted acid phosphatase
MRLPGHTRTRAALAATASAALLLGVPAVSGATTPDTALVPHSHFVMQPDGSSGLHARGDAIPNIDSVKATIRAYYNAPAGEASKTDSPYITEMHGIEDAILEGLPTTPPLPHSAVVFDADDTTLWTYDMEDKAMHFNFDSVLQGQWVHDGLFPATPGMVDLVQKIAARGYDIYGITGRGEAQEPDTLANLSKVGYVDGTGADIFNADNIFTKFASADTKPAYLDCASGASTTSPTGVVVPDDPAKCSTVEYKAGTRKYIETPTANGGLGETILLNIGDQFSDLQGGYSMRVAKLPNPTYYLPSADLTTPGPGEAAGQPRTEFTMVADGSSGLTEGGAGIPNIDSVKSTIRNYYGAVDPAKPGIANKTASPYIDQMTAFSKTWTDRLSNICTRVAKRGEKPAVVFDADDTTLWTYDMEDGAMKFNFDPTLQNTWVQEGRFLPVPKMQRVVRAAAASGCKIVGITGRNNAQRVATLDNLNKYYTDGNDNGLFKTKLYFTKWNSTTGDTQPAYVTCAAAKCTTVEYKSQTRKHVEDEMGLRIVANFGDQFSDLLGGHSDRAVKLPNPTYYLP